MSGPVSQIQLVRPPVTKDELWNLVHAMWGVAIPRVQVCEGHVSPFDAFAEGYFGNSSNWALWYGSRGCLAGDTRITISRAGLVRSRPISKFVHKYNGTTVKGRPFDHRYLTYIQQAQGEYARLGELGAAWDSGVKQTYQLTTTGGRRIRATAEHPFLVDNQTFTPLADLQIGQYVAVNVGRSNSGRNRISYARDHAKYHPKADRGVYWRHRMVAEAVINGLSYERYLDLVNTDPTSLVFLTDEHVHHINGDPTDNDAQNLLVLTQEAHHRLHAEQGTADNVLEQIGLDRVADIRAFGEEPTYDLTMAEAPNNYIANDFVVHNTGKSYMLAILALTKAVTLDVNVVLLGGSMAQSKNVHEHVEHLLQASHAPRHAIAKQIQTELLFNQGNWVRPIPASQTTVRGPHPHVTLLDEIDEMEKKIYDAAMGQAMTKPNARGHIVNEMTIASSTWQRPVGTFQEVRDEALTKGLPIRTWCVAGGCTGVITARGEVDITEVTTQDRVLTRAGWRQVQHVTPMGKKPTVDVELDNGRTLRGTSDHLVAVGDSWVPLGSLVPGDALVGLVPAVHAVKVVGVHTGVTADVWDIGVEGDTHEFVANGVVVHNCFREVLITPENPYGWMPPEFIERKRASVPAEMFRVEYEMGEPSGSNRAFDIAKTEEYFVSVEPISETHKANDDEWIFEKASPLCTYVAGADWAKEEDKTVIVVFRTDIEPHPLVYMRRINRRSWPDMVDIFNRVVNEYRSRSAHDATGVGNVVNDMVDERVLKVLMVDQKRRDLLNEYVSDFEQGYYRIPRVTSAYNAHRATTMGAIWSGAGNSKQHLPDEVAACALANRARRRMPPAVGGEAVGKTSDPPKVFADLNASPEYHNTMSVTMYEPADDVGVFWL